MVSEHYERLGYRITNDVEAMDSDAVHAFLRRSYWAQGVSKDVVERSLRGALCFGLFKGELQVGLARVITDRATFGYLSDVYVLDEHRGQGLARWLVQVILSHPELQGLRRFMLATKDAHGLYEKLGFAPLAHPEMFLEIFRPDAYAAGVGVEE
ncbi:MAG TPA: GNAT family N-acetyltransferase [Polyangiaceae bacterium]|nr:GNAT family N-acetyltransferase [Polyangiaceae bacterium]